MREIKFRAWDAKHEQMVYGISEIYEIFNGDYEDVLSQSMQYIGMKDKNRKEIYEGDIVNGGMYNGSYAYGKVEFCDGCFVAIPVGRFLEGYDDRFDTMEIIGNIYENEDLIK